MAREVVQPGLKIVGVGSALPERMVSNEEISGMLEEANPEEYALSPTDDRWIRKATGIEQRPIGDPESGEATGGLAVIAGRLALERSGVDPLSIEMLLLATTTPDDRVPATAPIVQEELGLENAPSPDINAACSGFVYSLAIADAMMARHGLKRVMVIGGDTLANITDYTDRTTAPLFADGAGAVILESTDEDRGLIGVSLKSKGNRTVLYCPHYEYDEDQEDIDGKPVIKKGTIKMASGRPVFEAGIDYMVQTSQEAMEKAQVSVDEVKVVIGHQANLRMLKGVSKELNIPWEKFAISIDHIGNSSSATIPVTLDEFLQKQELKPGDIVVMPAAGAGMTGGAIVQKW